jgi:hypothetical protein
VAKPTPQGGLVIRYDYLWLGEERKGREEGAKLRPCALVVAIAATPSQPLRVVLCGITHSRPADDGDAIRMPPAVKAHLGLDREESWIVTNEVNLVDWDDPGIVPVTAGGAWSYGFLPPALAKAVRDRIVAQARRGVLPTVDRPQIEKRRAARQKRERPGS